MIMFTLSPVILSSSFGSVGSVIGQRPGEDEQLSPVGTAIGGDTGHPNGQEAVDPVSQVGEAETIGTSYSFPFLSIILCCSTSRLLLMKLTSLMTGGISAPPRPSSSPS